MSEPFLAEIRIVSFNFAPKGWAFCNGQLLPINQNQALFAILGTTYGGDGRVTFALPNLQGRTPIHLNASHPLGERGGEEAHLLNLAETPSHTHGVNALRADAAARAAAGLLPAWAAKDSYERDGPRVAMDPGAITASGGGQPHSNLQPYLVLNFVIALQGIFPSRT